MPIRRLPESLINRIAAGEVVERPAAAVKELVENAIDAGATSVSVLLREGGQALIAVTDDGCGMGRDELLLALERHATSKLPDEDLWNIHSFGFRGEALPSIASVSRLSLTSRARGADQAWQVDIEGGAVGAPFPAALTQGTRVEVRDLFYSTPARLKFLKTPRTENDYARENVERIALAHPAVSFTFQEDDKKPLTYKASTVSDRIADIMGRDFIGNAAIVDIERDGLRVNGFAALPTLHAATTRGQHLFVNGRPVRDKQLLSALRAAYGDLLPSGRHPLAVLFITIPSALVDVNVHPAKTEVRFRDAAAVRGMMISGIRHSLQSAAQFTTSTLAPQALQMAQQARMTGLADSAAMQPKSFAAQTANARVQYSPSTFFTTAPPQARSVESASISAIPSTGRLGAAVAQLHETFIVAQTENGVIIVDQHAAHERIVYEKMKQALNDHGVKRQILLVPEIIDMDTASAGRLMSRAEQLAELGLVIEAFGGAIMVREIPAMIGNTDVATMLRDMADELAEFDESHALRDRLEEIWRDPRLPRLRAFGPHFDNRGNERPAAPNGIHPQQRPNATTAARLMWSLKRRIWRSCLSGDD